MMNDLRHSRPPLNADELRQLYDANPSPAVRRLLWEIHRLRLTVICANDVRRCLRNQPVGVPLPLWELFLERLDAEPCLRDGNGSRRR